MIAIYIEVKLEQKQTGSRARQKVRIYSMLVDLTACRTSAADAWRMNLHISYSGQAKMDALVCTILR